MSYSIPICFFSLNTEVTWDGECIVSGFLRLPNQVENSNVEYLDTLNPGTHCCQLFSETHPGVELSTGAFCTWIASIDSLFFFATDKTHMGTMGSFFSV